MNTDRNKLTADWVSDPVLGDVLAALTSYGAEARVVGGAVRNAILGLPVNDIDIATVSVPNDVIELANTAGMKVVATGIDHGTVTIVHQKRAFEVTTLREDVETHGRHATVRFGTSWQRDAERRDFTMNALYMDPDGSLFDPVGGYDDCVAGRVRFIGRARDRIEEDYLRILRYFRFYAQFDQGSMDDEALHAAISHRDGLRQLSRERIGQEFSRLLMAPGAAATITVMVEAGLAGQILGGVAYHRSFAGLADIEAATGRTPSLVARYAALAGSISEDAVRVAERLRLSNEVQDGIAGIYGVKTTDWPLSDKPARAQLYGSDPVSFENAVLYAWAKSTAAAAEEEWREFLELTGRWTAPKFPVSGRDLLAAGASAGPEIGRILSALEGRWIADDFQAGRDEILSWIPA